MCLLFLFPFLFLFLFLFYLISSLDLSFLPLIKTVARLRNYRMKGVSCKVGDHLANFGIIWLTDKIVALSLETLPTQEVRELFTFHPLLTLGVPRGQPQ